MTCSRTSRATPSCAPPRFRPRSSTSSPTPGSSVAEATTPSLTPSPTRSTGSSPAPPRAAVAPAARARRARSGDPPLARPLDGASGAARASSHRGRRRRPPSPEARASPGRARLPRGSTRGTRRTSPVRYPKDRAVQNGHGVPSLDAARARPRWLGRSPHRFDQVQAPELRAPPTAPSPRDAPRPHRSRTYVQIIIAAPQVPALVHLPHHRPAAILRANRSPPRGWFGVGGGRGRGAAGAGEAFGPAYYTTLNPPEQ